MYDQIRELTKRILNTFVTGDLSDVSCFWPRITSIIKGYLESKSSARPENAEQRLSIRKPLRIEQ